MKTMKKLIGIAVALVMTLGLTCTAFAAGTQTMAASPETKGSITIDGYAGEDYTIYQILDLTYSDSEPVSYSYTVVSE